MPNLTAVGLRGTGVIVEKESDSSDATGVVSVVKGLETCCIDSVSKTGATGGSFKLVLLSGDKFAERRSGREVSLVAHAYEQGCIPRVPKLFLWHCRLWIGGRGQPQLFS
jgi:hypothetical protein